MPTSDAASRNWRDDGSGGALSQCFSAKNPPIAAPRMATAPRPIASPRRPDGEGIGDSRTSGRHTALSLVVDGPPFEGGLMVGQVSNLTGKHGQVGNLTYQQPTGLR